jgi:beta-lactamase regulating signal transducer with metallopeptidase domain
MMADPIFLYLLRASIIWTLLLAFYWLAFHQNDNWQLKRLLLLSIYVLGLALPLLPTLYEHTAVANYYISDTIFNSPFVSRSTAETIETSSPQFWTPRTILTGLYLLICLAMALRIAASFFLLNTWRKTGQKSTHEHYSIVKHPAIKVPVAGFRTIFLPTNISAEDEQMACLHEKIHLGNGHSWERLPLLLGSIFLWFHPLQWLFQHLQEQVQEYEVDEGVLQHFSLPEYGKLLIQASMAPTMAWQPNLFSSPLKNRIDMMCKTKNKQPWRFYHSLILSLLLGFIIVSCTDAIDSNPAESYELVSAEELDQIAQVADIKYQDDDPWRTIFKGIGMNVKYPLKAREKNIEGTVVVQYVIDANGDMQDLVFLRPMSSNYKPLLVDATFLDEVVLTGLNISNEPPLLEQNLTKEERTNKLNVFRQEVKRVLEQLDWQPAIQNGQPVASVQRVPIRFKLQ